MTKKQLKNVKVRLPKKRLSVTESVSWKALKPLAQYCDKTTGAFKVVTDRLTKLTGQQQFRANVGEWLNMDPDQRSEPRLGMGLLMLDLWEELDWDRKKQLEEKARGKAMEQPKCGHQDDSDRVGSKNIRLRSVVASQCVSTTGSFEAPINSELPISALECSVTRHSGVGVGSGSNPRAFRPGIL